MRRPILFVSAIGVVLALGLAPRIAARVQVVETPRAAVPKIEFEKYVILSEDHRLPLTAVNLWYHDGPANEERGRTGFAHLFEHMMFQD